MGDFFLDFRPPPERQLAKAAGLLRFGEQTHVVVLEEPAFGLVITFTEDPGLGAPYRGSKGTLAAVAGRVALDEPDWHRAEALPGPGGLASKAVYQLYREQGLSALEGLGGSCVLFLHDATSTEFIVVTDCAGAFPAFRLDAGGTLLFSSHPDVLAAAAGAQNDLDETSMAEFLLTSTVTPPYTYYRRIRALAHGTVTTIQTATPGPRLVGSRRYFDFSYQPERTRVEDELAEELAVAFRKAVLRRTLPRFGRTAVALSGGLDSRAILACVENKDQTFAFCCFNEPNRELAIAQAIAAALRVPFVPWQRPFEYYGDNAEMGVRISGGMGTFANNHFLGIIDQLHAEGARNLLTGCYCDYLFKALPLNLHRNRFTGRERLEAFRHEFYFSHNLRPSCYSNQVRERLESRIPVQFRNQDSDDAVFQVEARRTFPLCYEADNQQRVVPQRVTGWYLPMADRDILNVYRRIPWRYKLNRSVYSKAIRRICGGPLARIPDANTGVRPGASLFEETLSINWLRAIRKLRGNRQSMGTDSSWPNWHYYVRHSKKLQALWKRPNPQAFDLFRRVLSPKDVRADTTEYPDGDVFLLVPMLSLKLWFEQWHG